VLENSTPGSTWRGLETGLRHPLNGHEAGNGGHSQGDTCGAPRQSSTLLLGEAVETSASFEARSAPLPYPTPDGPLTRPFFNNNKGDVGSKTLFFQ
jgi:hypothetical protein